MKLTRREKIERGIIPAAWGKFEYNSYPRWVKYENEADKALASHKGKKALKLYEKSMDEVFKFGEREIELPLPEREELYEKRTEQFYRIKRKHDRLEASLSGKRKYLSGKGIEHHETGLASKVSATVAIVGLVGSILFMSPNFTGNVIGNSNIFSNTTGAILFFVGLTGAFFYLRKR